MKQLTFYINPDIYAAQEKGSTTANAPGERHNIDFERHHRSAAETGLPDLSPDMQKAMDTIYKKPRAKDNVIYLSGEEGAPVTKKSPEDDPSVLGD